MIPLTKQQLESLIKKYKSFSAVALALGVTRQTIRRRAYQFNLESFAIQGTVTDTKVLLSTFEHYRGLVTIQDIVESQGLSMSAIRDHLRRAICIIWGGDEPPSLPRPRCIAQIKVYHALTEYPDLSIEQIQEATGLSYLKVRSYMMRIP